MNANTPGMAVHYTSAHPKSDPTSFVPLGGEEGLEEMSTRILGYSASAVEQSHQNPFPHLARRFAISAHMQS
jgi:hypothetical protein